MHRIFPGCITTAYLEETERLMKEAIEFHLEGLREDGLPIPRRRPLRTTSSLA